MAFLLSGLALPASVTSPGVLVVFSVGGRGEMTDLDRHFGVASVVRRGR